MTWKFGKQKSFVSIKVTNAKINRHILKFSKIDILPKEEKPNFDCKFLFTVYDGKLNIGKIKNILIDFIKQYDKSDEINCVYIGEDKTWFDKNTRSDLISSLKIQKEIGKTDTVLWYKVGEELKSVNLTIDKCLDFLYKLVIYGDKTYNVTQNHIKAINELTTIDEIMNYNITENYPAYVKLTTKNE